MHDRDLSPEGTVLRLGWRDVFLSGVLTAVAATLYLPRLLPGTGYSPDTMKYHYIGAVLGISHPPGSPLYMLASWVVAQAPFGELAWRLNLLSAVCAALAATFLYLVARDLARSRLAAAMAGVALLTAAMFWEQSVIAEVYTMHATLLLAAVWFLWRWRQGGRRRDLGVAAALYGLSFGVHVMSVYLLPGWIAVTLVGKRSILRIPRDTAVVAAGALLGASTYLYYAIRPAMHPAYVEYGIDDLQSFLNYVAGGDFRNHMFAYDARTMLDERLPWLAELALANAGLPLLVLGVIGFAAMCGRDRGFATLVGTSILTGSVYAMGYAVGDPHIFGLPALYLLLIASAVGVAVVCRVATRVTARRWTAGAMAGLLVLIVWLDRADAMAINRLRLDRSGDTVLAQFGARALDTVADDSVIVVGTDWSFHLFAYYFLGQRVRPDAGIRVEPHALNSCDETLARVDDLLQERPVYATGDMTGCILSEDYDLEVWDFSRTLPGYLAAIPSGRLVLIAIEGEATAAIDGPTWSDIMQMGVLEGMYNRTGWSYAAALVRTPHGFRGIHRADERSVEVTLARGERIAADYRAPFNIEVRSGGLLSALNAAIVAGGTDYARPFRGVQIVLFDAATGTPLERVVFDTRETTSLREAHFFRILGRKVRGARP